MLRLWVNLMWTTATGKPIRWKEPLIARIVPLTIYLFLKEMECRWGLMQLPLVTGLWRIFARYLRTIYALFTHYEQHLMNVISIAGIGVSS